MNNRKSPLRDKPLRQAGQSLQEYIDDVLMTKAEEHILIVLVTAMFAVYEWIRWYFALPPHPISVTIGAVAVAAWYVPKLVKSVRTIRRVRQGRDGERIVAEVLDKLREQGAAVFHDIKASDFNVDHVIASRKGVYAIETKTYSKSKDATIHFDGTTLTVDGFTPSRDPIRQSRAIATWVSRNLRDGTAKKYWVKPVLVFPGWFVNPVREHGGSDVWVLNPDALPKFVQNEPDRLSEEEFRAAAFHFSRIARG